MDPTIFRRYLREEFEEVEDENAENAEMIKQKKAEMNDYKMPRRKTTRRKAAPRPRADSQLSANIPK